MDPVEEEKKPKPSVKRQWLTEITRAKSERSQGTGGRGRLKKMIKCIFIGKQVREDKGVESLESSLATRDYSASGFSAQVGEAEPQANPNTIEEAELSLRASGYLNYEEARALLGRLEYQKGNMEAAFHVFDGIDIKVVTPNIKISLARKFESQRRDSENDAVLPMSMHAINLLFEAILLKAKSLQALGRFEEAAPSCQVIVDTVESAIPEGLNGRFSTNCKLLETLNSAVELLPELWKLAGSPPKAILSYRRALLYGWNLEMRTQSRIEKEFAMFLLYSGLDATPPTLRFQVEGAYTPCDNVEEAVLLLLLLLKKFLQRKIDWDPSIMDHLSFALTASGELNSLSRQLEELPAGITDRKDNYSTLALCYHVLGEDKVSLNLLRNLLKERGIKNCTHELLLASKICAEDTDISEEGIEYSEKVIKRLEEEGDCELLTCKATCLLGILSSAQSKLVTSDSKRVQMQSKALDLLGIAESLTKIKDANVIYHLALENAEQRKLDAALSYAKKLLKLEAGSGTAGWVLLARILSGQKRYFDAETIVNAALEQTGKWEQAELLRTRAKLEIAQGKTKDAIQTYTHLLAVLQVRKNNFMFWKKQRKEQDKIMEMETWHDLANIYTSLSQWQDAEVCLSKSEALFPHSASRCHSRGLLYQAKGLEKEAQKSFWDALDQDPNYVPSLISMAKIIVNFGQSTLPIAISFIRQAIRLDRTNHTAWKILGLLHRSERDSTSMAEALECFEAAALLEQTAPVEPFK